MLMEDGIDTTTRLVGLAGSLRAHSFNRALLEAALETQPEDVALEKLIIDDVPLYNGDVEAASGLPDAIRTINAALARADGLVIFTPEYNASIPGVLKNTIDWLSRPDGDSPGPIRGMHVALLGASPSSFGTFSSQSAWLPVLRTLRMRLWVGNGPFYVPKAGELFEAGAVVDADLRQRVADYIAGFAAHVRAQRAV